MVPAAITDPRDANVVGAASLQGGDGLGPDAPWGAQASYYCAYPVHTEDPDAVALTARSLPQFVRGHDRNWTAWCKAWPVPDRSDEALDAVVSPVPALLFRGALAPEGNPDVDARRWRAASRTRRARCSRRSALDLLATGPPCLSELRRRLPRQPAASPADRGVRQAVAARSTSSV